MKHSLSALCIALAAPATAQVPEADCAEEWRAMIEALGVGDLSGSEMRNLGPSVTGDGFCRLRSTQPGLQDADFDTFDWALEGRERLIDEGVAPMAAQVRFGGLRIEGDPERAVDVDIALRQVPDSRLVLLEQLKVTAGQGDSPLVTAVVERVDLSSRSMTQVSSGSAALTDLTVQARLGDWFAANVAPEIAISMPETEMDRSEMANGLVELMPDDVWAPGTREAVVDFLSDLPEARGALEFSFRSEAGVGLSKVGRYLLFGEVAAFGRSVDLQILFDDARLDLDWRPE